MIPLIRRTLAATPTPMAGLALGIASLGMCWENGGNYAGRMQWLGAAIAMVFLAILTVKFLLHPHMLRNDLSHPVVGSVVPTYAMATMVVSKAIGLWQPWLGTAIWLLAVLLHLAFLFIFACHRARDFKLEHMVPSWFVPPVGIIVAAVAFPGVSWLEPFARGLLWFGLCAYALMLPVMLHRLIFGQEVPDAAKPTIAVLAAPASLSLAGYLALIHPPSIVLVAALFGISLLMTVIIYLAFLKLLALPFSPGYAAFTFPLVIGATAQFKTAKMLESWPHLADAQYQVHTIAMFELRVATPMVGYVVLRYLMDFVRFQREPAQP